MKVIMLSEVASLLRQLRCGRGYIGKFINTCTIEDAIPLDKVKQAREEIRKLDDLNPDYPMDRTIHVSRNEVLEILDKLIAESEET